MLTEHQEPVRMEVPHEPGNHFSLRPLSKAQMDKARGQVMQELVETFGADNVELIIKMQAIQGGQVCAKCGEQLPEKPEGEKDELAGISPASLIRYGLKSWEGPLYTEVISPDTRAELDSATVDWAAREILHVSEPTAGESRNSGNTSLAAASAIRQPDSESPSQG